MVSEKNPNAKDSLDDVAAKGQRILASWWLLETLDIWIICLPRVAPASHTQPCVLVLAMVGRERGEYARHRHSLRWLGFLGDLLQHPLSSNPTPIQPLSSNNHLAHQCNNLWYRRKCWKCLLNSQLMVKTWIVVFFCWGARTEAVNFPFSCFLVGRDLEVWYHLMIKAWSSICSQARQITHTSSVLLGAYISQRPALCSRQRSPMICSTHTLHQPVNTTPFAFSSYILPLGPCMLITMSSDVGGRGGEQ